MISRAPASLLLLSLCACDVDSTVGYNDGERGLAGGVRCAADSPLARCSTGDSCVVTNLFEPPLGAITLAVDDENVFFLTGPQSIGRRPLNGGPVVDLASADDTLIRMTSDDTHVYWTENNGDVRGVAKAGGPRFDAGRVFGNPTDIAVDDTHLYWIFPAFGQVAMAPKPSGEATHISGQAAPQAIATDAKHVYWVNGGMAPASGQLVRALRGDLASAEVLLSGLDAPLAIALSNDAVYWASKTEVFRLRKDAGATAEPVASGFAEVKAIRVYGDTVYGVGMEGLWRVPVTGGERLQLERRMMSGMALACSGVYATGWFESAFVRYAP